VVTDRYVELGQLVNPGMPAVRLIDPYTLKLEAYLTGPQVGWVTVGHQATILLGENEDPVQGEVTWVAFEADRQTGKFKIEIEIPNPDLKYSSGVIGRARLGKNQVHDVVAVPRDAILPGRAGPTAFVVEGDRARLRRLELGTDQGLMVVVRSGLVSGEQLVVRGQRDLADGSLVKVTETATAADGSLPSDPEVVERNRAGSRISGTGNDAGGSLKDQSVEAGR
jgi:RND family efflux transporter MFP subunit